jgi:hypothetical protein
MSKRSSSVAGGRSFNEGSGLDIRHHSTHGCVSQVQDDGALSTEKQRGIDPFCSQAFAGASLDGWRSFGALAPFSSYFLCASHLEGKRPTNVPQRSAKRASQGT